MLGGLSPRFSAIRCSRLATLPLRTMPLEKMNPNRNSMLLVPIEMIERRIDLIRGQKVMLDAD